MEPAKIGLFALPSLLLVSAAPVWSNFLMMFVVVFSFCVCFFFNFAFFFFFKEMGPGVFSSLNCISKCLVSRNQKCSIGSAVIVHLLKLQIQMERSSRMNALWLDGIAACPWKSTWAFNFWVCRVGEHQGLFVEGSMGTLLSSGPWYGPLNSPDAASPGPEKQGCALVKG